MRVLIPLTFFGLIGYLAYLLVQYKTRKTNQDIKGDEK